MTMEPIFPSNAISGNAPVGPGGDRPSTNATSRAGAEAPAFRMLLDQLEQKAAALGAQSESVYGPEDLAGAVGDARASLEDALSIGDRILDAYREAVQRGEVKAGGEGLQP